MRGVGSVGVTHSTILASEGAVEGGVKQQEVMASIGPSGHLTSLRGQGTSWCELVSPALTN